MNDATLAIRRCSIDDTVATDDGGIGCIDFDRAAVFAFSSTADASHVKLDVVAPSSLTVGNSARVQAVLHSASDDLPIAGATVTFHMEGSFGGVTGDVEIGKAITDENGVALLDYQPRSAGEHRIRIQYLPTSASEPEEVIWSHSVVGADQQLYRSTSGVQVPGVNAWLLMALVAGVWAVLLSVALRVIVIARAGTEAGASTSQAGATGGR